MEERNAIINAFENNLFCPRSSAFKHSYYTSFVKFLFLTGCRPSEAIALQWKHISQDFRQINFEQAVIKSETGKLVRQGLKTQERRKFPCNDSLCQLLKLNKLESASSESFIFPSPKKKVIDIDNFRGRVWKRVINGLGIEYRTLYQTRHTFITHALETGKLDAKDVGRLVGNSPEIIYQHYAGNKRELFVPEF
ncbi:MULTISPECIES: site-specific integrase [Nostocaceae]|uniref:site-specific integrase n=1 Tax=Nostocaceae TaxID=1162 RepID=UPI001F559EE8|nr:MULTISPECIES: site-specific integrase [Nostocaceae]